MIPVIPILSGVAKGFGLIATIDSFLNGEPTWSDLPKNTQNKLIQNGILHVLNQEVKKDKAKYFDKSGNFDPIAFRTEFKKMCPDQYLTYEATTGKKHLAKAVCIFIEDETGYKCYPPILKSDSWVKRVRGEVDKMADLYKAEITAAKEEREEKKEVWNKTMKKVAIFGGLGLLFIIGIATSVSK